MALDICRPHTVCLRAQVCEVVFRIRKGSASKKSFGNTGLDFPYTLWRLCFDLIHEQLYANYNPYVTSIVRRFFSVLYASFLARFRFFLFCITNHTSYFS